MSTIYKKGFTLIELLVVIAIIGAIAAIVVPQLNTARSKGDDAVVKSSLSNVRSQAELYRDTNGNYGDDIQTVAACPTSGTSMAGEDATIKNAIAAVDGKNGSASPQCAADDGSTTAGAAATTWVISSALAGGGTWCVDSAGFSGSGKSANVTANVASCQ